MRFVKEFALEPKALADWPHFRYLYEKLGFSSGCLGVRLPSTPNSAGWEKEVLDACVDPVDRLRIEECFRRDGGRRLCDPPKIGGFVPRSWREYAKAVHSERELAGVVTAVDPSDPAATPPVLHRDEVTDAFFDLRREWSVAYTASVIAEACRPLLRMSARALIIDPYFKPTHRNRQNVLRLLLTAARDEGCEELVIVTDDKKALARNGLPFSDREILDGLEKAVPNGGVAVTLHGVEVRTDSEADLHHRLLLTEVGAIRFDKGFEETRRENDIALVDARHHRELVRRYLDHLERSVQVRRSYRWPKPGRKFELPR